jgi:NAD(P)-dependent dehydrogenase (short-subunit alcohol dehydrogenase family)
MSATTWTAGRIPDQTGRTFIVTGANSGLGLVTSRQLVRRGGHVIMAVRDQERGERTMAALASAQPGARLEQRPLDLADLDSVRAFAEGIRVDGVRPDVLINNAGVMMPPRALSPQGNEIQFASNHLGHFALTGLLLDILRTGNDPRVVTVSSLLHRRGRIHFDDLAGVGRYSPGPFYGQSKLANVLFGLEFDRRLRAAASPVRSLLAHPGFSATNLQTSGPTGVRNLLGRLGNLVVAQHAEMGALPQLYAATEPDARSGQFIGPAGFGGLRGHPVVVRPGRPARDPATARRLWEVSEELTGVRYDLPAAG